MHPHPTILRKKKYTPLKITINNYYYGQSSILEQYEVQILPDIIQPRSSRNFKNDSLGGPWASGTPVGMVLGFSCAFVAVLMVPEIRLPLSLKGPRGKVALIAIFKEESPYLKAILEIRAIDTSA